MLKVFAAYDRLQEQLQQRYGEDDTRARLLLIGTVAVVVLVAVIVVAGVLWLVLGLIGAVVTTAASGLNRVAASDVLAVVTRPVRAYLSAHAAGLPATPEALWQVWALAGPCLWLLGLFRGWAARLAWILYGAATVGMVYAGSPPTGQALSGGLTVLVWAVLSLPVLAGVGRRPRTVIHVSAPSGTSESAVAMMRDQVTELHSRLERMERAGDELAIRRSSADDD
ncbi:hypothetical protein [Microbispora sp. NBRC 16548]|uniref:hypothetical protein n=1 Tax=Microbispora sp. NBRC 16548 TaxID=3030994 RepID=UPI002553BC0B|nr:hypothetical protein [Microbispora sp. NBRC 16548]